MNDAAMESAKLKLKLKRESERKTEMTTAQAPTPPPPPSAATATPTLQKKEPCQRSFDMSDNIDKLATALAKAQGAFVTVAKNADNPFFQSKYATLAACVEMLRKPIADNGLSYTQFVGRRGDCDMMLTLIMHNSGQYILHGIPFKGAMGKAQEVGSTLTYARRYGLCAAFGIVVAEEDDDGNAANGN